MSSVSDRTGNITITYPGGTKKTSVAQYGGGSGDRTGKITVTYPGGIKTITVTQKSAVVTGFIITISASTVTKTPGQVNLTLSNITGGWAASVSADWISLNSYSGTGSTTIVCNYTENTGSLARVASITVTPSDTSIPGTTVSITQVPKTITATGEGASTPCSLLKSEFNQAFKTVLSSNISSVFSILIGMVQKTDVSLLTISSAVFDSFYFDLPQIVDTTIDALESGLEIIQNCSGVIGSDGTIQSFVNADLASIGFGGVSSASDIAGLAKNLAISTFKDTAISDLYNYVQGQGLGGAACSLQSQYEKLMESSGITDCLQTMKDGLSCMGEVCDSDTIDVFTAYLEIQTRELCLTSDFKVDSGRLWGGVSSDKVSAIAANVANLKAVEDKINAWNGGAS